MGLERVEARGGEGLGSGFTGGHRLGSVLLTEKLVTVAEIWGKCVTRPPSFCRARVFWDLALPHLGSEVSHLAMHFFHVTVELGGVSPFVNDGKKSEVE